MSKVKLILVKSLPIHRDAQHLRIVFVLINRPVQLLTDCYRRAVKLDYSAELV
jgi:hypothetical protein